MRQKRKNKTRRTGRRLQVETLESRTLLHAVGVLTGSVFLDTDGDGVRDAAEAGLPGIVMRLSGSGSNNAVAPRSTFTDDNGIFSFDGLEEGTYQVAKRQTRAAVEGLGSTTIPDAALKDNVVSNIVLADDQTLDGILFADRSLRPDFVNITWFFASARPAEQMLRETVASSEELAGNRDLADSIRTGGSNVPDGLNNPPDAVDDRFTSERDQTLTVDSASGVLANDLDLDGDALAATLVSQPSNGTVELNNDGSFSYTPNAGFRGTDAFSYQASDGIAQSNVATVLISVDSDPVAVDDEYTVQENGELRIAEASGVLVNDTDPNGDGLRARQVRPTANGLVLLSSTGAFVYSPDDGFSGIDTFTYTASDGTATSNVATVTITVTPDPTFGPVTTGSFEAPGLLGIRTDLVPGAPPITNDHIDGDLDYTGYSNPPTYGDHHGFDPDGTDVNPGITPRPTGVYDTEQPDEDLIHNIEHGHVWISYNPNLISGSDLAALQQLVQDGSPNPNGGGVGVILTPRSANDSAIALASWARLLTLEDFDAATIRDFVETNRGKAPEGFITP